MFEFYTTQRFKSELESHIKERHVKLLIKELVFHYIVKLFEIFKKIIYVLHLSSFPLIVYISFGFHCRW